jgi:hypothetical protein
MLQAAHLDTAAQISTRCRSAWRPQKSVSAATTICIAQWLRERSISFRIPIPPVAIYRQPPHSTLTFSVAIPKPVAMVDIIGAMLRQIVVRVNFALTVAMLLL